MLVPLEPVADRGPEAAGTDHVVVRHVDVPAVWRAAIRLRQPRDDARVVPAPRRVRKSQRLEDAGAGERFEIHTTHALHQRAREQKTRVRVRVVIAHRIIQRLLIGDDLECVGLGMNAGPARPPLPRHQIAPFAQPRGVREQVPHGDRASVTPQFGEVLPRVVVEAQLAVGHEQHDGSRGELLRHRPRFENCRRHDGTASREVGHAVAPLEQRGAAARDPHAASRRVGAVPRRKHLVGDGDQLGGGGLLGGRRDRCAKECQQQHRCGHGAHHDSGGDSHRAKLQHGVAGRSFQIRPQGIIFPVCRSTSTRPFPLGPKPRPNGSKCGSPWPTRRSRSTLSTGRRCAVCSPVAW